MYLEQRLAELQGQLYDLDPLGLRHNSLTSDIDHGIGFLNGNYPLWPNRIDLDLLDMADVDRCVLGQVVDPEGATPGYWVVRRQNRWSDRQAANYGFLVYEWSNTAPAYRLLTIVWSIKIIEHHLSKVTE